MPSYNLDLYCFNGTRGREPPVLPASMRKNGITIINFWPEYKHRNFKKVVPLQGRRSPTGDSDSAEGSLRPSPGNQETRSKLAGTPTGRQPRDTYISHALIAASSYIVRLQRTDTLIISGFLNMDPSFFLPTPEPETDASMERRSPIY